jgi:hypothetical protein
MRGIVLAQEPALSVVDPLDTPFAPSPEDVYQKRGFSDSESQP